MSCCVLEKCLLDKSHDLQLHDHMRSKTTKKNKLIELTQLCQDILLFL